MFGPDPPGQGQCMGVFMSTALQAHGSSGTSGVALVHHHLASAPMMPVIKNMML